MAEFTSNLIMGVVFFLLIVTGGVTIISEFRHTDSTYLSGTDLASFNSTFNKMDNLTSATSKLGAAVNKSVEGETPNIINLAYLGFGAALKSISTSFSFMFSAINGLTKFESFGIPGFIPALFIVLILLGLAFAIIKIMLGGQSL